MRTPGTIVRGVFVCFIILGAVFLLNVNLVQSGVGDNSSPISGGESGERLGEQQTETSSSPSILAYIPMVTNRYKVLQNQVIVANGQAFDKCTPPRVEEMQTWWDESPYSTINIYLGGISALCPYQETDPDWLTQVARQGWSFILTWAGPLAPPGCHTPKDFNHPMSIDPALAYLEGRAEADVAVDAAAAIGFKGELVIYYDIEGYEDTDKCRTAVASLIKGWSERLHELDVVAGAYGSPCRSYIADWVANDPPPDNVWIAHWYKNDYYLDASVWDVPCLDKEGEPPELWLNSQRLKQYTGDHYETWGDLKIKIDSNVLDGQVNALLGDTSAQASQSSSSIHAPSPVLISVGPAIEAMDLLNSTEGWLLAENLLLWTKDGGTSWQEITPQEKEHSQILSVFFLDPESGWLVRRSISTDKGEMLSVLSTADGGLNWQEKPILDFDHEDVMQVESASLDFVDSQTGWIALKLQSSSNFSLGRLLSTRDGGLTWQERTLPLGESVQFLDGERGWITGGPLDQTFYTGDGGKSWSLSGSIPGDQIKTQTASHLGDDGELPEGVVALELLDNQIGWAVVENGFCTGYKPRAGEPIPPASQPLQCETSFHLLMTNDGGITWRDISPRH
ncbi:glycoside hydrolase domain-containing protein [Chloroflexota bacterium]